MFVSKGDRPRTLPAIPHRLEADATKSPCVILGDTGRGNPSCKILGGRGSRRAGALCRFSARREPRPPSVTKTYF